MSVFRCGDGVGGGGPGRFTDEMIFEPGLVGGLMTSVLGKHPLMAYASSCHFSNPSIVGLSLSLGPEEK